MRLLSSDPRTRLLEAPLAVPTAAYLTAAFSWDRLQHLARERQGLGRLLAMATRMTLPRDDERRAAAVALAPEVREALVADRVDGWAERSAERALREAAAAWEAARVRGVVLVTGDVGDGKRALLDRILPELAATRRVVRARLDRRLLDEGDAIAWLAHALDQADLPGELEAAIDAIEALPPAVIAVEGLERAFLRTVGGFSGLRALLYALNAISGRHLVLVTAHRLAWAYLRRLGPIVNVEVVRETIDLEPLGEKATRRLALERLRAAGHEVRFDALVRPSPFGVDPAVERERATGAFFQLLADAAEGNPEVAMHLLSRCLVAHSDGSLEVRVHESLGSASLTELTENEMFTLVALRTQGQLTEEELVGVTNLGPGVIRNVVRNLVSRGLLARDGALCSVRVDQLPAVTRTLRRRHFLHFSG